MCTRAVADCSKNKYGTFKEYTDRGGRCCDAEKLCNWFLATLTVPAPAPQPEEPKQGSDDGKKRHWVGWLLYLRTGNSCAEAMADYNQNHFWKSLKSFFFLECPLIICEHTGNECESKSTDSKDSIHQW